MSSIERILLGSVPVGLPRPEDFHIETIPAPACPQGGVLVETRYLSVDPYLRGRISGVRSYAEPIRVGSPMFSSSVGVVLESQHPGFALGDFVQGFWPWQTLATPDPAHLLKLNPEEAPVTTALGILGVTGMTAYFGLTELCTPKAGETVFVSGAAGAVGSAVGQIAKILGCRAVGSAGSDAKVSYIKSLGFDAGFDYHVSSDYLHLLDEFCPDGIDCYFDNVGGNLTEDVFRRLNPFGRVAICGQISQYNDASTDVGRRPFLQILTRQLRVEGFIVSRWFARFPEGRRQMLAWYQQGLLKYEETIYKGLTQAPQAFIGLFRGENTGKAIVEL